MILKIINKLLKKLNKNSDMKSILINSQNYFINKKNEYDYFTNIQQAEFKVFSQNGEDGIIDYLLYKLDITNPKFIEIGVENYEEANTRLLYEIHNSEGTIIDANFNKKKLIEDLEFWKGRIQIIKKFITSKNINEIINKIENLNSIDLFSIDIDGIDYWIIDKIPDKISKIFIAEFNPVFGPDLEITVPDIDNFNRTKYHHSNLCWGASLKAIINLMKNKGYSFIGTNSFKNNAFFINQDFEENLKIVKENTNLNNLSNYTNHKYMESRDAKGNLNFLTNKQQISEIKNCKVIDLSNNTLKKISELI